jgi:hypothetical protein
VVIHTVKSGKSRVGVRGNKKIGMKRKIFTVFLLLHVTVLYSFLNLKHNQNRNVQHVLWWVCNPPPQEAEHLEKVDQGDVSSQP